MLLKFDSAFAATASAGKGFSLTVSAIGLGNHIITKLTMDESHFCKLMSSKVTLKYISIVELLKLHPVHYSLSLSLILSLSQIKFI